MALPTLQVNTNQKDNNILLQKKKKKNQNNFLRDDGMGVGSGQRPYHLLIYGWGGFIQLAMSLVLVLIIFKFGVV